jgi:hypothetical protein
MATFQGAPLTHEAAEGIKRGWLGGPVPAGAQQRQWSWLVAAGKNPAYVRGCWGGGRGGWNFL